MATNMICFGFQKLQLNKINWEDFKNKVILSLEATPKYLVI